MPEKFQGGSMGWLDIFLFAFAGVLIIMIARGAIKAFVDFQHGRHHDKQEGQ